MAEVLTSIILDTRRPLKDGTYPVKLRITYKRERKYFPTKYSFTENDFTKTQYPKPKGEFKQIQIALQAIEQLAIDVKDKLPVFSFEAFEKRFLNFSARDEVFAAYEVAIARFNKDGQVGTANTYENAKVSLLSFIHKDPLTRNKGITQKEAQAKKEALLKKKKPLPFASVTTDFLKEYEKWMLQQGKSPTTVSMYLRTLRTLFNEVIAAGDVHPELYPFGKRKYQVPAARNIKKALTKAEVEKIYKYETNHEAVEKARDYWLFSYLCNGINLKDIARLKYRQVNKDTITFVRAKTERTTRQDQRKIVVTLTDKAAEIIEKWSYKPVCAESYVFPILTELLTPEKEMATIKQAIKTINKYMKRIAAELGIDKNVSTYSARHSFSTILKRAGAPTAFISEALGHSTEKTTQSYLDSFEDDVKRKYSSLLTDFDK